MCKSRLENRLCLYCAEKSEFSRKNLHRKVFSSVSQIPFTNFRNHVSHLCDIWEINLLEEDYCYQVTSAPKCSQSALNTKTLQHNLTDILLLNFCLSDVSKWINSIDPPKPNTTHSYISRRSDQWFMRGVSTFLFLPPPPHSRIDVSQTTLPTMTEHFQYLLIRISLQQ